MENKIDITKINQVRIGSYLTKEEFINTISNLNFTHIKAYDIDFITGFEYNAEDNETRPRGYSIRYN